MIKLRDKILTGIFGIRWLESPEVGEGNKMKKIGKQHEVSKSFIIR